MQWHWQDKNGQLIDNYSPIDIGNLPSQTVYAFVRPKILKVSSGLGYYAPIDSASSYEYYVMKDIPEVTNGTIGGYSDGSIHNNAHAVSLSAYRIGETEVTQELYKLVMAVNPSYFQGSSHQPDSGESKEKRPVEQVNWYDAVAFCNELTCCTTGLGENKCVYTYNGKPYTVEDAQAHREPEMDMSKKGFRLPTEAEWEWAAQGGTARQKWAGTNNEAELPNYAWYDASYEYGKTHQVGKKTANLFGLFDMTGNVKEWCWDWFDKATPAGGENPVGPSSGIERTTCSGSFVNNDTLCRCAFRYYDGPKVASRTIGFRIVRRP